MEIMDTSHVLLVETKSADFLFSTESKIFLWSEREVNRKLIAICEDVIN